MELDALETKALELIRSRLQNATVTTLSAERGPQNQITVKGTYQDAQGHKRNFEVRFQLKDDTPQIAEWSVS